MTEKPLSEQDEEFLEDISSLSEDKKNSIIAYIQNKLDAQKEQHTINPRYTKMGRRV